jgi:hypothetical protein
MKECKEGVLLGDVGVEKEASPNCLIVAGSV